MRENVKALQPPCLLRGPKRGGFLLVLWPSGTLSGVFPGPRPTPFTTQGPGCSLSRSLQRGSMQPGHVGDLEVGAIWLRKYRLSIGSGTEGLCLNPSSPIYQLFNCKQIIWRQFPILQNVDNNSIHLIRPLWGLNGPVHVKQSCL